MRYLLPLLLLLSSCDFMRGEKVTGNGKIRTENIKVGDSFDEVEVSGALKVHLIQGTQSEVRLETDDNLIQYVEVSTHGGTLEIKVRKGYRLNPSKELLIFVTAPVYKNVDVSGACQIIGDSPITGSDNLSLDLSGASSIQLDLSFAKVIATLSGSCHASLKGSATDFEADLSGASELRGYDLQTQRTQLDLSGASHAQVTAAKELSIDASGASTVKYKGSPNIKQQSSGASSVSKVD